MGSLIAWGPTHPKSGVVEQGEGAGEGRRGMFVFRSVFVIYQTSYTLNISILMVRVYSLNGFEHKT